MYKKAFSWWNKAISTERGAYTTPEIQEKYEMDTIWLKLSPIIKSLLKTTYENDVEYWIDITNILEKMFPSQIIPNPVQDFPNFVIFLFNNRSELSLDNSKSIDKFVDVFCSNDNLCSFFQIIFVVAASIPPNVIKGFSYLHKTKNSKWMSFIQKHGSTERIIDLFITFLNHSRADGKRASDCNENSTFLLHLADFATKILIETDDLTLSNEIISNFYTRLLKLIKYTNNEHSVTFLRCAIDINNKYLSRASPHEQVSRIVTLIASTQTPRIIRPIVLKYSLQQVEKGFITSKRLLMELLKQSMETVYELETLQSIAVNSDSETKLMTIKFLSKKMISSKVSMRISAKILANLLKDLESDEEIRTWFTSFTYSLFCFFKIAYARHRYIHRVLLLCEVLSSDIFDEVPWAQTIFANAASCAYTVGSNLDFMKAYFTISRVSNAAEFETLLSELSSSNGKLKTLPFKANSLVLLENSKHRGTVKLPREVSTIQYGKKLSGIGLTPVTIKYVYENAEGSPVDQQKCIFELEDFIERTQSLADHIQVQREQKSFCIKDFPTNTRNPLLIAYKMLIEENECSIYEYQNSVLSIYINRALEIVNSLSEHPHLFANQRMLTRNLNEAYTASPHINRLKMERSKLIAGAQRSIEDSKKNPIKTDIFDAINFFIMSNKTTKQMMTKAAAGVFQKKVSDVAINIIGVENNVQSLLNLPTDESLQKIADCIIRIVFDNGYSIESDLCLFTELNNKFVESCALISQESVQNLKLKRSYQRAVGKYGSIGKLGSALNKTCKTIEFMNNPLEITATIYSVVKELPKLVGAESLTNSELTQLLLSVLSVDPPSNAVSIAVFLNRFYQIIPYLQLNNTVSIYSGAIFNVIDEKEVRKEQSEIDSSETPRSYEISSFLLRACEQSEE